VVKCSGFGVEGLVSRIWVLAFGRRVELTCGRGQEGLWFWLQGLGFGFQGEGSEISGRESEVHLLAKGRGCAV